MASCASDGEEGPRSEEAPGWRSGGLRSQRSSAPRIVGFAARQGNSSPVSPGSPELAAVPHFGAAADVHKKRHSSLKQLLHVDEHLRDAPKLPAIKTTGGGRLARRASLPLHRGGAAAAAAAAHASPSPALACRTPELDARGQAGSEFRAEGERRASSYPPSSTRSTSVAIPARRGVECTQTVRAAVSDTLASALLASLERQSPLARGFSAESPEAPAVGPGLPAAGGAGSAASETEARRLLAEARDAASHAEAQAAVLRRRLLQEQAEVVRLRDALDLLEEQTRGLRSSTSMDWSPDGADLDDPLGGEADPPWGDGRWAGRQPGAGT